MDSTVKWLVLLALLSAAPASAGGIYGGVTWRTGYYHTTGGSELRGTMLVQPYGAWDPADPDAPNLTFLDLTATNRSPGSPELYVRYFLDVAGEPQANLDLLAWSCTPSHPCLSLVGEEPLPAPGWVLSNWRLRDHPEYVGPRIDNGGHSVHSVQFISRMEQRGSHQHYTVMLWNQRTLRWDTLWAHSRAEGPKDCADNTCANNWGPILEAHVAAGCTYSCTMPKLREVGWEDMVLTHDGGTSYLKATETGWVAPHPSWQLFHRTPNRSYTVGNLSNGS